MTKLTDQQLAELDGRIATARENLTRSGILYSGLGEPIEDLLLLVRVLKDQILEERKHDTVVLGYKMVTNAVMTSEPEDERIFKSNVANLIEKRWNGGSVGEKLAMEWIAEELFRMYEVRKPVMLYDDGKSGPVV